VLKLTHIANFPGAASLIYRANAENDCLFDLSLNGCMRSLLLLISVSIQCLVRVDVYSRRASLKAALDINFSSQYLVGYISSFSSSRLKANFYIYNPSAAPTQMPLSLICTSFKPFSIKKVTLHTPQQGPTCAKTNANHQLSRCSVSNFSCLDIATKFI